MRKGELSFDDAHHSPPLWPPRWAAGRTGLPASAAFSELTPGRVATALALAWEASRAAAPAAGGLHEGLATRRFHSELGSRSPSLGSRTCHPRGPMLTCTWLWAAATLLRNSWSWDRSPAFWGSLPSSSHNCRWPSLSSARTRSASCSSSQMRWLCWRFRAWAAFPGGMGLVSTGYCPHKAPLLLPRGFFLIPISQDHCMGLPSLCATSTTTYLLVFPFKSAHFVNKPPPG